MSALTKDTSINLRHAPPLELRLAGDAAEGTIAGYGSAFAGPPDSYGDVIAPGAFAKSLTRHKAEGTTPVMLWSHDPSEPIGVWTEIREDSKGLRVKGTINLETQRGREALALIKQGGLTGLSIGFMVGKDGRRFEKDGSRTLTEVDLWEISLVSLPANRRARILSAKSVTTQREFETFLHQEGFPNTAAKRIASGGWSAIAQGPHPAEELNKRIGRALSELKSLRGQ